MLGDEADAEAGAVQVGRAFGVLRAVQQRRADVAQVGRRVAAVDVGRVRQRRIGTGADQYGILARVHRRRIAVDPAQRFAASRRGRGSLPA